MVNRFHTNHHPIVIDTPELAEYLEDAMIARDMPGMADIDSSLLLFCKNVKPTATVSLTGECADEILVDILGSLEKMPFKVELFHGQLQSQSVKLYYIQALQKS